MPSVRRKEIVNQGRRLRAKRRRVREFLTKQQEEAALLVAQGVTQAEVARKVGVSYTTIKDWLHENEKFATRVAVERELIATYALDHSIACKEIRISALSNLHDRINRVIEERAESKEMSKVPGGKSGLLVKTIKGIGSGDNFTEVEEYTFDAALSREKRAVLDDVAAEMGGRINKLEHSGPGGQPLAPPVINVKFVSTKAVIVDGTKKLAS